MKIEKLGRTEPLDFRITFHNGFREEKLEMNRSDAIKLLQRLQNKLIK